MMTVEQNRHRPGPRPLPLHLGAAILTWTRSRAASESLRNGFPPWKMESQGPVARMQEALTALAGSISPSNSSPAGPVSGRIAEWIDFQSALDAEISARLTMLIDGILAYRRHPYRRIPTCRPVVWQIGTTRLRRHGNDDGQPLLIIPSLINRYHVLDLAPGRSLLDHLDRTGFAPYVIDWALPGDAEQTFSLTDYITDRLDQALDAILGLTGKRPAVIGYCMGGLLALALAQRRRHDIVALMLMATPWDFSTSAGTLPAVLPASRPALEAIIDTTGVLPTDIIQSMFCALDPLLVVRKFMRFAEMDMKDPETAVFVALEDWINDGVPLAGPVAREAVFGWYGENTPSCGAWHVAGQPVEPADVTLPSLSLIPSHDRIVPPASAAALSAILPDSTALYTPLGHIGMVVSGQARTRAWAPMVDWLNEKAS